jgi:hypothetical protein
MYQLADNPVCRPDRAQLVSTTSASSNDRLLEVMQATTATPEQIEEAARINTESRLRALKIGLLLMAGVALIAIFPASRLPAYKPNEIPHDPFETPEKARDSAALTDREAAAPA